MSPRPWVAMKLTAAGVANWAAMTRSPSFSRSSESSTITIRPARISSIASATVAARLPDGFAVALIPHTIEVTTLGPAAVGRAVNLELDVVAKYVEALVAPYAPGRGGT